MSFCTQSDAQKFEWIVAICNAKFVIWAFSQGIFDKFKEKWQNRWWIRQEIWPFAVNCEARFETLLKQIFSEIEQFRIRIRIRIQQFVLYLQSPKIWFEWGVAYILTQPASLQITIDSKIPSISLV